MSLLPTFPRCYLRGDTNAIAPCKDDAGNTGLACYNTFVARLAWSLSRDHLTLKAVKGKVSPGNFLIKAWRREG